MEETALASGVLGLMREVKPSLQSDGGNRKPTCRGLWQPQNVTVTQAGVKHLLASERLPVESEGRAGLVVVDGSQKRLDEGSAKEKQTFSAHQL